MRAGCVGVALALVAGCSSARIPTLGTSDMAPRLRDDRQEWAYQEVLERYTRSYALYDVLDSRLFARATWHSPAFAEALANRRAAFKVLPESDRAKSLEAARKDAEAATEFFLAVHANDPKADDFGRPQSPWRVALVTSAGEREPVSVERLGRTNTELRAAYSYLEPFWTGYRVRFTKLSPGEERGMVLRLASALGQADLSFATE